jgi:hypothetical protein
MRYVLLNANKKGVLLTRAPEEVTKGLVLEFDGAGEGLHAVINSGEKVIYRPIEEGKCTVEAKYLYPGNVYVAVKSESGETYKCDALTVFNTDDALIAIMNTDERDKELPDVRTELAALEVTMSEVKDLVEKLKKRLSDIYDGVDIL